MEHAIFKFNMTFVPVTVTTETGLTAQGHLVQCASEGGRHFGIHEATGTALMHDSPLTGPLFLYQTQDAVDEALFDSNKVRQVPIYNVCPNGTIIHANGQKLAFNWPERCQGKIEIRFD